MSRRKEKQNIIRNYVESLKKDKKEKSIQEALQREEEREYWEQKDHYETYMREQENLRRYLEFNS